MNERINRTSICSVVFLDIIGYSKKPVSEQLGDKEHFNALINEAIKDVAQNDRILLDTGDGAAIALLGAPEEALFISLTIRDGILKYNKQADQNLFLRIGINLGPVRMLTDINGQPNIIGDGINVAQRVMSFAEPNQILVSRSYYEITSRLTKEITEMFAYSGVKHDKHVREHEVYEIRSANEEPSASIAVEPVTFSEDLAEDKPANNRCQHLMMGLIAGVCLVVIASVAVLHFARSSHEQINTVSTVNAIDSPVESKTLTSPVPVEPPKAQVLEKGSDNQVQVNVKSADTKSKPTIKKVDATKKKAVDSVRHEDSSKAVAIKDEAENKVNKDKPAEKSGWESFTQSIKQGSQNKSCSQGEIAMGQCH
jgi:class 3 adenylate cyclase